MRKLIIFILICSAFSVTNQVAAQWNRSGTNVRLNNDTWNVGIGTQLPNSKLHVNSAAGQDGFRVQIAGNTKLFVDDGGGVGVGAFATPPANGLFVSGRVGIGTTAPERKLHVFNGSAGAVTANANSPFVVENSTHNYIDVLAPSGSERGILFGDQLNAQDGGIVYIGATNAMQFRTNGNVTRMSLSSGGDLSLTQDGGGLIYSSGAFITDPGGTAVEIHTHGDFNPDTDGFHNLGSASFTWASVWAVDNTINTSDARLKENIQNSPYGLKDIMKLRPVTYTWKNLKDGERRIGLIAQEVQKIIPEMVKDHMVIKDEKTGEITKVPSPKLGLQYDALIPVLTKAIQEQQASIETKDKQITELKNQTTELKNELENIKTLLISKGVVTSSEINGNVFEPARKPSLAQSVPNPTSGTTTLSYYLPNDVKRASIMITSMSGAVLKTYPISQMGSGQLTINSREFPAGVYIYTLNVNGNKFDSKQMVIAR